jgi:ABC-type transporter Mla subunit MlaD
MLADRTSEIARVLEDQAKPLIDRFSESGGELQRSLEEATNMATERLREENAVLVNALAARTAETLAAVDHARNTLGEGVADLIERLTSSNSQLGQLIDVASHNLAELDERLSGTTSSFATSAEKAAQTFSSSARLIDVNATKLTELSSSTLKDIAAIAHRFDDHSRVLATASDLLGSAQSNLASTLDDRQDALETLAVGLVKKSEDIERTMRSFENLVERTFEKAEGRTRETTEELRSAISEVVEAATQRFSDATQEIRRSAGVIRSELEETRADLRRGVLDLPEETKETTSAMRRAVAEQINALKELSDIVARSGRNFEGGARSGQLPRSAPAATRLEAPAPRPAEPPRRPQAPAEAFAEAPRAAAPRQPEAPQAGGWVSDLLRRASEDEDEPVPAPAPARAEAPQRSPLHVVESLNSLSVDIARAIDHEASIELWDRYRRGERNVFTRRLYTLKGQQTFDEIRRKYQTEPEFRTAVDRYCDDFERLIADVTRTDRDSMMAQTYLSSDTGKVYTMLAHASGRLK